MAALKELRIVSSHDYHFIQAYDEKKSLVLGRMVPLGEVPFAFALAAAEAIDGAFGFSEDLGSE